jgi:8-oxo-dGTP diphosphatase
MLLIASGETLSEISNELAISVKTVSTYRSRLLEKMAMENNAKLTKYVIENISGFFSLAFRRKAEYSAGSMTDIKDAFDTIDWDEWEPRERAVLGFIVQNRKVLLIHKKTGLGAGKINGPGGRIEPGETEKEAVIRELKEEVGVTIHDPVKHGELSFIFTNGYSIHGTIFLAYRYDGNLCETREAKPFWFSLDQIPYDRMWKDDPYWLPEVLAGSHIRGFFLYDEDEMIKNRIFIYPSPAGGICR